MGTAQIADGSITDAKIVSLNADVINAGTLSVDRLLLKGPDGLFVAINATDEGLTSEQLSQEEYQSAISGSVLVARSVTADKIAAKSITANEIAAGAITTAELAAESVDASKIKAGSITTSHVAANFGETLDISSNEQVEIIAGNVQQAQETADSAQEVAEQATPLTGAEPPEEAPAAGKLWIDDGQVPSVWRRWRGADVPTDREYEEAVSGDADSPAFVSIDNAHGQLQEVELEVGCVAQQAGAGDPSPSNIRAITGRESVEIAACGKNLYDVNDKNTFSDGVTVDADGWITVTADNSAGARSIYKNCFTNPSAAIKSDTQYCAVCEIAQIDVVGTLSCVIVDGGDYPNGITSQFDDPFLFQANGSTQTGTRTQIVKSRIDPDTAEFMLRSFIEFNAGSSGTIRFRISILKDASTTSETFSYEPYTPMGGGTVTPSEPLYGLPDAMDTVEVDASGDVTVTRRTAVVELDGTESIMYGNAGASTEVQQFNAYQVAVGGVGDINSPVICSHLPYSPNVSGGATLGIGLFPSSSHAFIVFGMPIAALTQYGYIIGEQDTWVPAFKSYLAAQKAAGTPVTIVYELAVPETEALTAITPITPEAGPVNIWTDADALTATVRGSGWEIINDTDGLSEGIDGLLDNVGSLTGALDSTQAQLTDLAAVTITRDEVESIVTSVDGRLSSVEQQAGSLDVVVAEMRGDVDNIMLGVHVGTGGVGIYRDGDPYQMNIDNRGMTVTEGGMETLSARESQVNANRMQVREALMLGSELALVVSSGKLRLQRR